MALNIIVSNSAGRLAAHFRDHVYRKRRKEELFEKEIVVVQSQGMSVWLNQQLAVPIAANLETPFLNSFADSVLREYFPEEEKPLMTEDWMFWRIFRLLLTDLRRYPELGRYVQGENLSLKACQLAEKTASLYDNYQMYPPELLKNWRESEADGCWQAKLYRALAKEAVSRDIRFEQFTPEPGRQPTRITVFGVSSLAPNYFEFFRKLGTVSEVRLYYLNPSAEYWCDNQTLKEALHRSANLLFEGKDPDEEIIGNPLLSSLGRQGKDFFRYLISRDDVPLTEPEEFEHPVPDWRRFEDYQYPSVSMLQALQEDILLNISRSSSEKRDVVTSGAPLTPASNHPDNSIVINSCHNDLRQVEVLYDQILRLLEDEKLEPRDILVMAPDIGVFEPYIQAVFGGTESKLRNHFTIADRSKRKQNICADTLLKVMQLLNGKFEAEAVLDLFENPELAARWKFSRQNLEDIRSWVSSLKVCWGINARHHEKMSGVSFNEFSWEPALNRLILGCATAEEPLSQNEEAVYPFDGAEGLKSGTAGNFAAFLHMLIDFHHRMTSSHSLAEWSTLIQDLTDMLFESGPRNYKELAAIRGTLTLLKRQGESELWQDWHDADLHLASYLLEKNLLPTGIQEPFLRGKITFCSLMPMRSIPMKVIAVLGLDEQSFPRKDLNSGFNIIPAKKRRSALERFPSAEDRFIFLEVLLAAREHLLLYYRGKNPLTGKKQEPAVPVKELIDAVNATFPAWSNQFIRDQKLRSYDPLYYQNNPDFYSYSRKNFSAAEVECGEMPPVRDLLPDTDKKDVTVPDKISPEQLIEFYRNPCEYYLKNVLHMGLQYDQEVNLNSEETVEPDKSAKSNLRKTVLNQLREQPELLQSKEQLTVLTDRLRKTNMLAVGRIGESELDDIIQLIEKIPAEWLKPTIPVEVSVPLQGITIEGSIQVEAQSRQLHVLSETASSFSGKLIEFYVKHLILCASGNAGRSRFCFWQEQKDHEETFNRKYLDPVSPNGTESDSPPYYEEDDSTDEVRKNARKRLAELVDYYCRGHYRPLAFFPNAGVYHARRTAQSDTLYSTDTEKHYKNWDLNNSAVKLFFELDSKDLPPVYEEFTKLSKLVFGFARGRGGEWKNDNGKKD